MVEVRRRDKESLEGMLRRFTKRIQQSELLSEARSSRFLTKSKSKRSQRQGALRRIKILTEKSKLVKLGKVKSTEKLPEKYRLKIKATIKK